MKKRYIPIVMLFLLSNISAFSQGDLVFNINHLLIDEPFELEATTMNDMFQAFHITRLDYYISEISIKHDGGVETSFDDVWIYVRASESTSVNLGANTFNDIESVTFHIGVDPEHNHLDIATYSVDHPLGPKNPSMHWGWAAGYRFVAYEGNGGPNQDDLFQMHGLGDDNYFEVTVGVTPQELNGNNVITVDADYAKGMNGLDADYGIISHGETSFAKTLLENFRDFVFSEGVSTSINRINNLVDVTISPNPTSSGMVVVSLDNSDDVISKLELFTLTGKRIYTTASDRQQQVEINLPNKGMYLAKLETKGGASKVVKLIHQ